MPTQLPSKEAETSSTILREVSTPHALSVSVVVPCRNEVKTIDSFLSSFLQQDLAEIDWEVLIADGLSDDGTRCKLQMFSKQHSRIRIINNPSRIVPTGLNAAIRAARYDVILRMDVHTQYRSDYIRRSLELLAQTGAASVGGACIARGSGYIGRAIAAAFHSGFAVGGARWHQPTYEGPADTVHLGCWRRELLEQVGLFDETLVRNQDDELNFRIRRAGGILWQSPEIVAWYSPRSSFSALFRQYFQYGFWRVPVLRKHRVPGAWRQLVPLTFVLVNLAAIASLVLQKGVGSGLGSWLTSSTLIMDLIYALFSLVAAFTVAKKNGWALFPVLPLVFATYHISYGVGFLLGIFYFSRKTPVDLRRERFFTSLSR